MTTDNTAHPAPTSAPVAVPEGGWRDGDEVVRILSQGFQVGARDDGAWRFSTAATAPDWTDEDVDWMVDSGRIVAVHLAPRPEPVVAPLPSEECRACAGSVTRDDLNPTDDLALCTRHWNWWLARFLGADDAPPVRAHLIIEEKS